MKLDTLLRLSKNPHYKMTAEQKDMLENHLHEQRMKKRLLHKTKPRLHSNAIKLHETSPEAENGIS